MNIILPSRNRGAALAVSLIILAILTLLGIAAMRSSRLSLRLSENAESRVDAMENAQTGADIVTNNPGSFLPIVAGPGYIGSYVNASFVPTTSTATCGTGATVIPTVSLTMPYLDTDPLLQYRYLQVCRDTPEFIPAAALRGVGGGESGRSYDFARFTITAGFDNSGNGMGAAEVAEGVMLVHVKQTGINYQ